MKNKIWCCNDNQRLEMLLDEWMIRKQIVNISSMIFVNGNFCVQIFYYDKKLNLNDEVDSEL